MRVDGQQFDVEDEGGAAGDAGLGELPVAQFGGEMYLPLAVLLFALPKQPVAYCGYLIAIVE